MDPSSLHEYELSRRPQLSLSQLPKDSEDSNLSANQPEPSVDHQEKIQHETPEQSRPDCENKPCIVANETQSTPTLDILAILPTTRLSFKTKATDTRYSIYHSFQEKGGEGASWGPIIEVVGSCEIILPTIDSRMLPAGTYDELVVLVAPGMDERSFLIGEVTVEAPTKAAILQRLSNRGYNVIGTGEEDEHDATDKKDEQDAKNELWESFSNLLEHHDKRIKLLLDDIASRRHPGDDAYKLITENSTRGREAVHARVEDIHNQPATKAEPTNQLQPQSPRSSSGLALHTVRKRSSTVELEGERKRIDQSQTGPVAGGKSSPDVVLYINKAEANFPKVSQSKEQILTDDNKENDEAEERAEEANKGKGVDESSIDSETTEVDTAQDIRRDEELDSEFRDDNDANSCTSVEEEIYKSKLENGRWYQDYPGHDTLIPDDEDQKIHLDMAHQLFSDISKDCLYWAPINKDIQRVVDLGTGTGIWPIEFADKFPSAHVIGLDLVPMQPSFVAPNCEFIIDDIEQPEWCRHDNICDFIHIRGLNGSIKDWPKLLKQSFSHVKPGAWIEHVEISPVFRSRNKEVHLSLIRFSSELISAGEKNGKTMRVTETMKTLIEDAGFINTTEDVKEVPFGTWAKGEYWRQLGMLNLEQFLQGLEGFVLRPFISILGYDLATTKEFIEEVKEVLKRPGQQLYCTVHVVYGQKPASKK